MKAKKNHKRAFPIKGIEAALRRAASKARELGKRTNTPVYVMLQGKIADIRKDLASTRKAAR